MESKEPKNLFSYKPLVWIAVLLSLAYLGYTYWVWRLHGKIDAKNIGTFGDAFGVINALFTGLAFLGAVIAVLYQARELKETQKQVRLQTEALELQTKELASTREEVRLQTFALHGQELEMKSNRLDQELSRGLSLVMQHVQLIRGLKYDDLVIFTNDCLIIGDYIEDLNLPEGSTVSSKDLHQKFPEISTSPEFESVSSTFNSFFATFNALSFLHFGDDSQAPTEIMTRLKHAELLFDIARAHIPLDIDTAVGKLSSFGAKIDVESPYVSYAEGGKTYWMLKGLITEFSDFEEMEADVSKELERREKLMEESRKSSSKAN